MVRAIHLICLLLTLVVWAQDDAAYVEVRWVGYKIRTFNVVEGNNDFVLKTRLQGGGQQVERLNLDAAGYTAHTFNNNWIGVNEYMWARNINSDEFFIDLEGFENDCGEDLQFEDPCDGGIENDDEHQQGQLYEKFRNFESGIWHSTSKDIGSYEFSFVFMWYPAPFNASHKQETVISSDFNHDLDSEADGFWGSSIPPVSYPVISDDNYNHKFCPPTQRTLTSPKGGSTTNRIRVYYEYFVPSLNTWKTLVDTNTYLKTIPISLTQPIYDEIKTNGELQASLKIRVYRKTANGVVRPNTLVTDYKYTRFNGPFYLFFMTQNYQRNIAEFEFFLYPQAPDFSSDTLVGTPPVCHLESNGELSISFASVIGFGMNRYQYSLRNCQNGPTESDFCPTCYTDSLSSCPIGIGTVRSTGQDTSFIGLQTGRYVLQVSDIESRSSSTVGCSNLYPVIIPDKPPISIKVRDTVYTNTNTRCFDSNDGIATVTISGGNPPYQASQDNVTWFAATGSEYSFSNLAAGEYQFYGGDSRGCPIANVLDTLSKPDTLRLGIQYAREYTEDLIEPGKRHVRCFHDNNGEYTVQAHSDRGDAFVNPNFRYWITGTNTQGQAYASDTMSANSTDLSGSGSDPASRFLGLSAGQYTIHLKDNNECYTNDTFSLREPSPLTLSKLELADNLCDGGKKGTLKVLANGATHPYFYYKNNNFDPYPSSSWRVCTYNNFVNGSCNANLHRTTKTYADTAYYSNLPSLAHIAYVKDTNGCISPLPFEIKEPDPVVPEVSAQEIRCKGEANGLLEVQASGGVPPYAYTWYNAGSTVSSDSVADNLPAGSSYRLHITDDNGCLSTYGPYTLTEALYPLSASAYITLPVSCADQEDAAIAVSANGGAGNYQYSLDGINWQLFSTFNNLAAGEYTVHVRDGYGCEITLDVLEILRPNALSADLVNSPAVSCFGLSDATVQLSLSGGSTPYSYKNGNAWSSTSAALNLTGLPAGSVQIEIRDKYNCQLIKEVQVQSPAELQIQVVSRTEASLGNADASATVEAEGGTAPHTYLWESGSTTTMAVNLSAGYHLVTVEDANGCSVNRQVGINTTGGATENSGATNLISPMCHTSKDGSISVDYSGTMPISYLWIANSETGNTLSAIGAGEWQLQVTDGNGAITTATYLLTSPEEISVQHSIGTLLCHDACNATVDLGISGGTAPFDVSWNTGATTASLSNLCAGTYSYQILDAHNCNASGELSILNPEPINVELGGDLTLCVGQTSTLDAGHTGSNYLWSTGQTSQEITLSQAGLYSVKVITPDGCVGNDTIEVELSNELLEAVFYISSKIYAGNTLVFVDVTYPRPENIDWDFGDSAIAVNDDNIHAPKVLFPYSGIFYVRMIAHLGQCSDTLIKYVKVYEPDDSTGYQNGRTGSSIENLNVYPNPARSSVTASTRLYDPGDALFHLVDGFGNIIKQEYRTGDAEYEWSVDLSLLSRGMYVVRVISGTSQRSVVLTVE
jgi:hypothetical protein